MKGEKLQLAVVPVIHDDGRCRPDEVVSGQDNFVDAFVSAGGALQYHGDAQGNFISPAAVVNNYSQAANVTPSSIYMGDQPLACESSAYMGSHFFHSKQN